MISLVWLLSCSPLAELPTRQKAEQRRAGKCRFERTKSVHFTQHLLMVGRADCRASLAHLCLLYAKPSYFIRKVEKCAAFLTCPPVPGARRFLLAPIRAETDALASLYYTRCPDAVKKRDALILGRRREGVIDLLF